MASREEEGSYPPEEAAPRVGGEYNVNNVVNLAAIHRELDRLMAETHQLLERLRRVHDLVMDELEGDRDE